MICQQTPENEEKKLVDKVYIFVVVECFPNKFERPGIFKMEKTQISVEVGEGQGVNTEGNGHLGGVIATRP